MNGLTNEQKAKVFAMYLGCKIKYQRFSEPTQMYYIVDRELNEDCLLTIKMLDHEHGIIQPKLILRPLSSLTDEEAVEVAKLSGVNFKHIPRKSDFDIFKNSDGNIVVGAVGSSFSRVVIDSVNLNAPQFQYLISIGIAVPLFIAPGHADNGKTAIELGLALDSTTL